MVELLDVIEICFFLLLMGGYKELLEGRDLGIYGYFI